MKLDCSTRKMRVKDACMIGIQLLEIVKNFHEKDHLVKNITPETFSFGRNEKITKLCGECFGLLAGKSSDILDKYINFLDDPNDNIRSGFYYGLKSFNFVKDEKLLDILFNKLLKGLNDSSIIVKQNAYNSLITFAHDYSSKFKFKFMEIWSCFELDCVVKNNLIETTDIGGGLKIKNDKGSPIRKAIFATIKIFIENIPEKINLNSAIKILLLGLAHMGFHNFVKC